jgi:hypothetical protein
VCDLDFTGVDCRVHAVLSPAEDLLRLAEGDVGARL